MEHIKNALELKSELDKLRPIPKEYEAKIMQKFRLDWNYHSNNLEGNSLTFGETRMLILHGITAQGKPLKDHFEITGHDEAIKWVEEIVKSDFPLTENFIRQLHLLLLKEPYEISAINSHGQQTKRTIEVGKYKSSPNHVLTKTGEIFYFAKPEETPAKMNDLLVWYRQEISNSNINPIILAAEFHYKFILIHPFDDGNGRVARVLMNFILMKFGFPPVIIKTEDKENYFSALRQADGGFIENFVGYIANNLVRSLQIMIAGAKGEEIEEVDDLDKKISLLKSEFKENQNKGAIIKTKEIILKICDDSLKRVYEKFIASCRKFDEFYLQKGFTVYLDGAQMPAAGIDDIKNFIMRNGEIYEIFMQYQHGNLNRQGFENFNHTNQIRLIFALENYTFFVPSVQGQIVKTYDQQIDDEEISELIKLSTEKHFKKIEEKIKSENKKN